MLAVEGLTAGYGDITIVRDLSLRVETGEIVALLGANGAGKTTTILAISGLARRFAGQISFLGERLDRVAAHDMAARGLVQVPEGKHLFPDMTVLENLELGAYRHGVRPDRLDRIYTLFPRLKERRRQAARTLSGGEQQMVAIGRALMSEPKLLMLDEPSQGLAPIVVDELFRAIHAINAEGLAILLVEQNAVRTLAVAHRAYIIENGNVALSGAASALAENPDVQRLYLGL